MLKYNDKLKKDNRVTILSLSWRDIKSPTAGGAEVQTHEMLKRANKDKFRIVHIAPKYENLPSEESIDGVNYIRKGNIITVIWYAFLFYKKNRNNINFVLDQCNTHRFFTPFWVKREKRIFYIHQLTREIWDINCRFPFNLIGKVMETPMLKIYKRDNTIALSKSTKDDLVAVGFNKKKIHIISIGIDFEPWTQEQFYTKESNPTFVYVGRYAKYKGIDVAIDAFGKLKEEYPYAKMWLLGKKDQQYVEDVLTPICNKYDITIGDEKNNDVICQGFVSEERKLELLSKSTALVFPSIREGWGIPITEAANVGTPSIVFDSPGIRDAIDFGNAGYLCDENSSYGIYDMMKRTINDNRMYEQMRKKAYEFSKGLVWCEVGKRFEKVIDSIL